MVVVASISTFKKLPRWFMRSPCWRTAAVRQGRGNRDGEEKVCLRDEMKWTKSSDLLERAGERGEKGGSKVNSTLQLRL